MLFQNIFCTICKYNGKYYVTINQSLLNECQRQYASLESDIRRKTRANLILPTNVLILLNGATSSTSKKHPSDNTFNCTGTDEKQQTSHCTNDITNNINSSRLPSWYTTKPTQDTWSIPEGKVKDDYFGNDEAGRANLEKFNKL